MMNRVERWVLLVAVVIGSVIATQANAAAKPATDSHILTFDNLPIGALQMDMSRMHYAAATRDGSAIYPEYPQATAAYKWLDVLQRVTADDVENITQLAMPTIIARQMMIPMTAMYDAWAAYDERAVGTRLGGKLRRPAAERTDANREEAIAYAVHRTMLFAFRHELHEDIHQAMRDMGYDPANEDRDVTTPAGIGNTVADALIAHYKEDGSNWDGAMDRGNGEPYSDWTGYVCVNTAEETVDPSRWSPKLFTNLDGTTFAPGALTPHWGRVKTVALESGDQFRPGPPPGLDDPRLKAEVDEVLRYTASLTPMQRAIVEFMRDGPRSTGQSGHWLRFAQDLSRRDNYNLEQDVKLFFAVASVCHDTFIACWDAKYVYDSPRPQALVRHYYAGQMIPGWKGYGKGVGMIPAEEWINYSPKYFLCPPFPSYPSGHSTVSAGASTILKLFSGSDYFGFCAPRVPGSITHEPMDEPVLLELPTFTATAEMAGISRVMGGYHTQADNIVALELGRKVANYSFPIYQSYWNGTAYVTQHPASGPGQEGDADE